MSLSSPFEAGFRKTRGGTVRSRDLARFGPRFWPFSLVKSTKRGSKITKIFRLRRAFPPSISIVPPLFRRPRRTPKTTLFWSVSPLITAKIAQNFRLRRSGCLRDQISDPENKGGGTVTPISPDTVFLFIFVVAKLHQFVGTEGGEREGGKGERQGFWRKIERGRGVVRNSFVICF